MKEPECTPKLPTRHECPSQSSVPPGESEDRRTSPAESRTGSEQDGSRSLCIPKVQALQRGQNPAELRLGTLSLRAFPWTPYGLNAVPKYISFIERQVTC